MKKIMITSLITVFMSGAAFADVSAQSGFFVGGNIGWSNPTTWNDSSVAQAYLANSATSSVNGLSGGVSVGYNFAVNPSVLVGAELGYMYLGSTSYDLQGGFTGGTNLSSSEDAFQFLFTTTYVMPNGFNVFAKAGAAEVTQTNFNNVNIPGFGSQPFFSGGTSAVLPAAAIGMGYMPNNHLNITLQYEQFFGNNNSNVQNYVVPGLTNSPNPQSVGVLSLGLSYSFGQS